MAPRRALGCLLVLVAACGDNIESREEPGTWYGEIGAIVRTKCGGCHNPGGVAPFSLLDYDDALEQAGRIQEAITTGIMPPWYANDPPDCTPRHPWRDNAKLSDHQRGALLEWIATGTPEGTKQPLPDVRSIALADPTLSLAPAEPFTSSGNTDQFVCFLFDPQLDHVQWLTGSQVTPTGVDLVHHVNVYLVGPGDADNAKSFAGGLGVPKLACDHPPGAAIQSWLPGNPALVLPTTVGIHVDPGTLVMLQVHYHPAGVGGPDATSVALRFTDTRPAWRFDFGVYGNSPGPPNLQPGPGDPIEGPAFMIPANATDHVERMLMTHRPDQKDLRVLSVTPHMHLLGTHQRVTLTHADGSTECLIDSGWDFDWQRSYTYDAKLDELPVFDASSTVDLSCRWNNSFSNPELPRLLDNTGLVAPYDVELGFTTGDEMCLADFALLSRY